MEWDDEFEPQDEQEPESLRKKWDAEEIEELTSGKKQFPCPSCRQMIDSKSFSCLYCGQRVFHDSGLIGKFGKYITGGHWSFLILLVAAAVFLLSVLF